MKIAFLFAGQVRNISIDLFKNSLSNLTQNLDYDIYAYSWEEKGVSLNHSKEDPIISKNKNASQIISQLFNGFNLKELGLESYLDFQDKLDQKYMDIQKSKDFHSGTINTLPQIYTLSKCYKLLQKNISEYDLIFRCRFDSLYVHPLRLYDLENYINQNNLYNINFGRAFYPKRVYDIFFGGSKNAMSFLEDIWEKLPYLIYDEFNNKLDNRDSCRIIYLAAKKKGINVRTFDSRICDVFRNQKNNFYEKYLISMHLVRPSKFYGSLTKLRFFNNWFFKNNLSINSFLRTTIKTALLIPIVYLKRIKYLVNKKYKP